MIYLIIYYKVLKIKSAWIRKILQDLNTCSCKSQCFQIFEKCILSHSSQYIFKILCLFRFKPFQYKISGSDPGVLVNSGSIFGKRSDPDCILEKGRIQMFKSRFKIPITFLAILIEQAFNKVPISQSYWLIVLNLNQGCTLKVGSGSELRLYFKGRIRIVFFFSRVDSSSEWTLHSSAKTTNQKLLFL